MAVVCRTTPLILIKFKLDDYLRLYGYIGTLNDKIENTDISND